MGISKTVTCEGAIVEQGGSVATIGQCSLEDKDIVDAISCNVTPKNEVSRWVGLESQDFFVEGTRAQAPAANMRASVYKTAAGPQ
jgi:hypothetical protein